MADAEVDLTAAKLMVEEAEKQAAEQKDSQLSAAKAKFLQRMFARNIFQYSYTKWVLLDFTTNIHFLSTFQLFKWLR